VAKARGLRAEGPQEFTMEESAQSSLPGAGADSLEAWIPQIQDLQRRVLMLEQRLATDTVVRAATTDLPPAAAPGPAIARSVHVPPNVLPVLRRVLLAIAGAYVLRALTDIGVMPRALGMTIGLIYAMCWLFFAARLRGHERFATVMTSSTSMLIMGPLVWEACVRLNAMSTWTGAGVVLGFAVVALTLSLRKHDKVISVVVLLPSTVIAAGLLLATYDLLPFTLALLALAAAAEFGAYKDYPPASRWVSAIAADFAVVLFAWLITRESGLPPGYVATSARAALATQLLLIAICVTTAVVQTVARRRTLSFAEMTQTGCALLVGIGGIIWIFKADQAAMLAVGVAILMGSVASYALAFQLFEHSKWNFRAWASYGLVLLLAGTALLFSNFWILWCGCAVGSCAVAATARRPTMGLHGAVYLLLGSLVSGAVSQPLSPLLAVAVRSVQWQVSVGVVAAAILSWMAIAASWPGDVARWRKSAALFGISVIIVWILAGFAAGSLIRAWEFTARTGYIPAGTLGTVVLTSFALALTWAGTKWTLPELVWPAYGLMILGAWKLATRDFVDEHNFALVVSLLSYGSALILLPRMKRRKMLAHNQRLGLR